MHRGEGNSSIAGCVKTKHRQNEQIETCCKQTNELKIKLNRRPVLGAPRCHHQANVTVALSELPRGKTMKARCPVLSRLVHTEVYSAQRASTGM